MKKIILLIFAISLIAGCGVEKEYRGRTVKTVGVFNILNDEKNICIKYNVSIGNVLLGAVLIETIIAPIYFFGFDMFNPSAIKEGCDPMVEGEGMGIY